MSAKEKGVRNPRKRLNALKSEIMRIKRAASKQAEGKRYQKIITATEEIRKLYTESSYKDDCDLLLARYANLESRQPIWEMLVIPLLLSSFTFQALSQLCLHLMGELVSTIDLIQLTIELGVSGQPLYICLTALIFILIVIFIACVIYLIHTFITSVRRNADSTIIENELCILRTILKSRGILINEDNVVCSTVSDTTLPTDKG